MQNVLLTEKQRNLLHFQKAKVIESGSTSGSDDKAIEPSVKIFKQDTPEYKKSHYKNQVSTMLNGYAEQKELNSIDVRLLYGLATKIPAIDPNNGFI